jgi:hypothetical protein
MWLYHDGTRTSKQISNKFLPTSFQQSNCNSDLIRSVTHIARMSWRTRFRFPLTDKVDITLLHTLLENHSPLTISVRSIKDRYFLQNSECDVLCCPLTENKRSRVIQRNGSNRVLSRYNYEFCIVLGIVRTGLSVAIKCLCGTYSKTTGWIFRTFDNNEFFLILTYFSDKLTYF